MKDKNPNGLGSLTYKIINGKKYWTGRVTLGFDLNGKQIRRSFSGYKKSEVIEKMQKAMTTTNIAGYIEKGDQLFGNLMSYWLYNIKAKEIKSTSLKKYDQTFRIRIKNSVLANTKIKDVNILKLQMFIDSLVESNKFSAALISDTLTLIKAFLDYTITIGILQTNPADYVKVPKEKKKKIEIKKYNVFDKSEQEKIINFLNLDDFVEQAIFIDFFTGLRHGELRGLKSKNFLGDKLKIDEQLNREYEFTNDGNSKLVSKNMETDLKTESAYRIIPLPKLAKNLMKKIKISAAKKYFKMGTVFNDESLLFVDDFLKPIEEKRLNRRVKSICKKLKIEKRTLHSIRHSYATRLFEAGIDIKTVQQLMGHSDYKTTLDIYTHVMPEQKEKAIEIFDRMYN